jgi:hypothetical protein
MRQRLAPSPRQRWQRQLARPECRTRPSSKLFVVVKAMSSVPSRANSAAPLVAAQIAGDQPGQGPISTPEAAALMGFSDATLRNYAWLNSLSSGERAMRKLQVPPAGLPVPIRKSGRLLWPLAEVLQFAEQKSKSTA